MQNLTVSMAAKYMKREPQALYLAIRKGRLKANRINDQWILTMKDIEEYCNGRYKSTFRKSEGKLIWNQGNEEMSVSQFCDFFKEKTGTAIKPHSIYYKLYNKILRATQKDGYWVISRSDALDYIKSFM